MDCGYILVAKIVITADGVSIIDLMELRSFFLCVEPEKTIQEIGKGLRGSIISVKVFN